MDTVGRRGRGPAVAPAVVPEGMSEADAEFPPGLCPRDCFPCGAYFPLIPSPAAQRGRKCEHSCYSSIELTLGAVSTTGCFQGWGKAPSESTHGVEKRNTPAMLP